MYFLRFYGEKTETMRKPTQNGVCQGPRDMNNYNASSKCEWSTSCLTNASFNLWLSSQSPCLICERGVAWGRRLPCHTCSRCVYLAERFLHWCMVVEQEELLEIFRRLVYKLVFTQCALFPQPSLREGSVGLRQGLKRLLGIIFNSKK